MRALLMNIVLLAVIGVIGCGPAEVPPQARPRAKVNLPETPSLTIPEVVRKHADGVWTVAGLRQAGMEGQWESSVQVRGVVLDRQVCPLRRKRNAEPCVLAPHLLVADSLEKPDQPLIVAGTNEQIHALPESGEVVVEGAHVQWSADRHFVDSRGIVQLAPPADEQAAD